jgi:hypothetical protein
MTTKKTEKFFIYAAKKSGNYKNKRLLGVNHSYEGGTENLTFQDLVDFLKEKNIDLSTVALQSSFITVAKV